MLTIQHLTKSFNGIQVLQDFSCSFPETGIVSLVGPSGCGKTTLLRCIAGLEHPDSGIVSGIPERIAYCFQEDRLLPWRTALGNLEAVLGKRARREALRWLSLVGLEEAQRKYPGELSGGMRSRVAFARALAFDAPLLLLDEPFHALDSGTRAQMEHLLEQETKNRLALLVTHHTPPEGSRIIQMGL
ncbi:ABC transporter ATP-binding protein [Anaeromassilibacillus sp. An200]|uniref:ABC transporter ATP-binding protein n=1 Tax=Anaeromassilibacillus sp. An200 TaxID=1965587 RepID=UPI000B39C057|nr:ABC transporter ATP-binding protein [Anaeromassilibacillus sp. An200]OUP11972.1 hypothetical protein B5F35_09420 [Anaeromassilibacillus sp. An200]